MSQVDTQLVNELKQRGLVAQMTGDNQLEAHLSVPRSVYCGFDPTADSLHIGSLVPLLTLKRFQMAGHKPIPLVGGATGLIGDPSFKAQERQLNTAEVVANWVDKLKAQVARFVSFDCGSNSAEVTNNLDWTANMNVLDFLRDVGKHFSVNNMINKESVKQRIDREGAGISYTEFTYMLLQSYDFAELYKRHQCTVQIGGSDQWGNITGGTDLTRRMHGGQVFGLTLPLVTKADGTKFGKTESGTIWLDAAKTSPYAFYQFWLNTADADVYKFLRYFTFLSLVHGEEGLQAAKRITEVLFSGSVDALSEQDLAQLKLDGLPYKALTDEALSNTVLTQLLVEAGMVKSGKQVKDALSRNAVWVNNVAKSNEDNVRVQECFAKGAALYGRFYMVKLGKKNYQLFERVG